MTRSPSSSSSPSSSPAPRPPITARLVQNPFVWTVLMAVLFGVPIYRSMTRRLTASPMVLGGLPAFTLTDQRGQPFGSRELAGKIWVADFMFTSCQGVCPLLTQRMAEVGKRARHLGPDFHLVSISVDPERDTPPRLAEYAARYGANPISWSFLTGSEQALQATVVEGFKVGAGKERSTAAGADGGAGFWEIFHGENLVLVDRQMRIRGYFPATPEGLDKLLEAVGRVAN
jgi:protein SCO1/2